MLHLYRSMTTLMEMGFTALVAGICFGIQRAKNDRFGQL